MKLICTTSRTLCSQRRSFTLIEMLTVLFLIAVLVGLAVGGSRLAWLKTQESAIKGRFKKSNWPWNSTALTGATTPFDREVSLTQPFKILIFPLESPLGKPYLDEDTEPYAQSRSGGPALKYSYPYLDTYSHNEGSYDLSAWGVDETEGTDDDINNWSRN